MPETLLVRGANTTITDVAVEVRVSWRAGAPVDPCALLVTPDQKVRGDEDFVFYNQPVHPSGAVRLSQDGSASARLSADLSAVPAAIDRIIIAGSVDTGTLQDVSGVEITVSGAGRPLAKFPVTDVEPVTAVIFGELYRRGTSWKFRAVGQGWDTGLAGLATNFGLAVEDESPDEATPVSASEASQASEASETSAPPQPDWYSAPDGSPTLWWWDGGQWTSQTTPIIHDTPHTCGRCGHAKSHPTFGGTNPTCARCDAEIGQMISGWRQRAAQVLATSGASGPAWEALRTELRYHRLNESQRVEALRPIALGHLQQLVTFAFADDVIEQHEMDLFDTSVRQLEIADPAIPLMRARMQRGLDLAKINDGDLPRVEQTTLVLEIEESLHLDSTATHVRQLASGPRQTPGRLIVTNRKLRFLSDNGCVETPWAKIIEVRREYCAVVVSATTAKGGGSYEVDDSDYVAAVLSGALRVAKRLASVPTQRGRDTRRVPPEVKAEVWRRDGGACVECHASEYLEFDHIIPWSRGGATSVDNLQLLCRRCNQSKGARI